MEKEAKAIPWWACAVIVATCTIAAFWFFGGQYYLAHQADVEYSLFTHEDEAQDPIRWLVWLVKTGACSAFIAFVISTLAVMLWNRKLIKH